MMIRRLLLGTALLVVGMSSLHVHAAGFLEKNFYLRGQGYAGELPACEAALPRITHEFAYTQEHFWAFTPVILGYERVREIAYNPWPLGSIPDRKSTRLNSSHPSISYAVFCLKKKKKKKMKHKYNQISHNK